jgi:hypothetical protein
MPTNERSIATSRRYQSVSTSQSGVVTIISGIPGSVSTHTPDVCYPGSGYRTSRAVRKDSVTLPGGRAATFYVADFEKTTATGTEAVRCRWAWTADGTWHAPDYPRLFFARSQVRLPVLYKLYVVHPLGDEDLTKSDPYRTFAADLAAALGRPLAP